MRRHVKNNALVASLFIVALFKVLLPAQSPTDEIWLPGGVMEVAVDERGIVVAPSGSGIYFFDARSNLQKPTQVAFLPE
ncbi:MAG: hypothetical protein HZRFUVUK_000970, partial [Candidatus Fervidibacterota bacterium]